jgi:hypothetical protein
VQEQTGGPAAEIGARRQPHLFWDILLGLVSGPMIAALLLLIPLGALTGLTVALDPNLDLYEFAPEEELLVPWAILAVMISIANIHVALVNAAVSRPSQIFTIRTEKYRTTGPEEEETTTRPQEREMFSVHAGMDTGWRHGRHLVEDIVAYIGAREPEEVVIDPPEAEDYGWSFMIGTRNLYPLQVAISFVDVVDHVRDIEEYELSVDFDPPFLPWKRFSYQPDVALRDRVEGHIVDLLKSKGVSFTMESEE